MGTPNEPAPNRAGSFFWGVPTGIRTRLGDDDDRAHPVVIGERDVHGAAAAVWDREHGLVELPVYYMDHLDLVGGHTGWRLEGLRLEQPGLKVFDFHPNIVFTNASTEAEYLETKAFYHDPQRLMESRRDGPGARDLWLRLLDWL